MHFMIYIFIFLFSQIFFSFESIAISEEAAQNGDWNRIYLATYPRSGNHWVRFLIEEATHIATSSMYRDGPKAGAPNFHLDEIFPWGGYCADHGYYGNCRYPLITESVVIKTHYPEFPNPKIDRFLPYTQIIRIVRHPLDSFYSWYVYRCPKSKQKNIIPDSVLNERIIYWNEFQSYWNAQALVTTIRYEDLYLNPHHYLRMILDVIGYQVLDEDIERAISKYPPCGGFLKHANHYTDEQKALVDSKIGILMRQFDYNINEVNFNSN